MLTSSAPEPLNPSTQNTPGLTPLNLKSIVLETGRANVNSLLAHYQKLTNFGPYKLGFKLCEKSFEVHVLSITDNAPAVIARIELSGARAPGKTVVANNGNISIKKPDRGRLEFLLSPGSISVKFSALAKPGGISITILSQELDLNGKPKLGVKYQKLEVISFQRQPSEEGSLKQLATALSTNAYSAKGLLDDCIVAEFCSGMKDLFQNWSNLEPRERILMLRLLSNKVLMNAGVYPCYFPERYIADWHLYCPNNPCCFAAGDWSIHRSGKFVDKRTLSKKEELNFACSLYEELRKAEQAWLTIRHLTATSSSLLGSLKLSNEILRVIEFARQFSKNAKEQKKEFCESFMSALAGNHKGQEREGELTALQKLRKVFHLPYLLTDIDSKSASKLLLKQWRQD